MPPRPPLTLRLLRPRDADAQLVLVRADGTSTHGTVGPAAGFGPVHDLAHYVVERRFALADAFLGLVAAGWTITDFERRGASRTLPDTAMLAESMAGELSREAMMQQPSDPADFAWAVTAWLAQARPGYVPPAIEADVVLAMREELAGLRARWDAVPVGGVLELAFEVPGAGATPARPVGR